MEDNAGHDHRSHKTCSLGNEEWLVAYLSCQETQFSAALAPVPCNPIQKETPRRPREVFASKGKLHRFDGSEEKARRVLATTQGRSDGGQLPDANGPQRADQRLGLRLRPRDVLIGVNEGEELLRSSLRRESNATDSKRGAAQGCGRLKEVVRECTAESKQQRL
jgi:hypothetical protein